MADKAENQEFPLDHFVKEDDPVCELQEIEDDDEWE